MHNFIKVEYETIKQNDYNLVFSRYAQPDLNPKNSEWEMVKLGDLANNNIIVIEKGKMITKKTVKTGDIPVIAGGRSSPYSHNKTTHEGNVITISASGEAGFVWYHNTPIWASDCNVLYSKNNKKLLTKYLYYSLHAQQENIYSLQSGSVQKHIYKKDIDTFQIQLPPIETQHKIVEEFESIENRIKQIEDIIKQEQEKFDCILNEL